MNQTATKFPDPFKTPSHPDNNGWKARHLAAMQTSAPGSERAISLMLQGLVLYAKAHQDRFESAIGEDGVLGPCWEDMARGLIGLLNGDCGRLDCGTIDGIIRDAAQAAAVDIN